MTFKSIIDVEVNDSQFTAFHALFKEYEATLANMPDNWKEIGGAINATATDFQKVAGGTASSMQMAAMQSAVLANGLKSAIKAQREFGDTTKRSLTTMDKLGLSAAKLGHNIFGISKFLIGASVAGAGVFGGLLFGLDKLANSAMGTQSGARGADTTTGQYQAFKLNYANFLNPEAIMQGMSGAKRDATGQMWLRKYTGMNDSQIAGTDSVTLAMKTALAVHDWMKSLPNHGAMAAQIMPSTGFDKLGYSAEDAVRLMNTPRSELLAAQSSTNRDSRSLGFNDRTAANWVMLSKELERAGLTIRAVLINQLASLGPKLSELADALAKGLATFIKAATSKENMKKFTDAIDSVGKYLSSGEFQKNIAEFGTALGNLAEMINALAKTLGFGSQSNNTPGSKDSRPLFTNGHLTDGLDNSIQDDWDKSSAKAAQVYESHKKSKDNDTKIHDGFRMLAASLKNQKHHVTVTAKNTTGANLFWSANAAGQ